jgi:hypothetical protein
MTKSSSPAATPRNTTTPRKCNLTIRTTIKCGISVTGGDNKISVDPVD